LVPESIPARDEPRASLVAMFRTVVALRLVPVLLGLGFAAAALVAMGQAQSALAGSARLPDLDQVTPADLVITRTQVDGKPVHVLGFSSAVENVGNGPLVFEAHRPGAQTDTMVADQVIDRDGAPKEVVPGVGRVRYTVSPDHRHWHLLGFDRYELRRAGQDTAAVRDRKSGFCLGDRYATAGRRRSAASPEPVFTSRCGLDAPELLGVREGISVGYGDNYQANLEGQYLPLTGLRAGRYVLVHTVNADGGLRELDYANNSASLLLELRWRQGAPQVRVLKSCPDTGRCDARPAARPTVRTVASGLEIPWEIAFLPNRSALVTERPGRVRLLRRDGTLRRDPVARVRVSAVGEGGLLGLAVDPRFRRNRFVYLYYTTAAGMRLERWRYANSRLVRERSLVDGIAAGRVHDSGRIAFGPDGRLYIATGDAGDGPLAQDPSSLNGKFLALSPGQYRGAGGRPAIVSSGHRNPQGFDWEPGTRRLLSTEHGPTEGLDGPGGFEEINRIVQGGNYGWPRVYGFDQSGFDAPLKVYRRPLAPSGATFLTRRSAWKGSFVFAALRGEQLRRLELRGDRVIADEPLLRRRFGRLRTVVEAPDGELYVLTSNRDGRGVPGPRDDRILRVTPPR
jgi:glucose/arabinose dehydrogenase